MQMQQALFADAASIIRILFFSPEALRKPPARSGEPERAAVRRRAAPRRARGEGGAQGASNPPAPAMAAARDPSGGSCRQRPPRGSVAAAARDPPRRQPSQHRPSRGGSGAAAAARGPTPPHPPPLRPANSLAREMGSVERWGGGGGPLWIAAGRRGGRGGVPPWSRSCACAVAAGWCRGEGAGRERPGRDRVEAPKRVYDRVGVLTRSYSRPASQQSLHATPPIPRTCKHTYIHTYI